MTYQDKIKLTDIIAPSFYGVYYDVVDGHHTHYWLKGGRYSTKSSFVSASIILGIAQDALEGKHTNAIVIRRYATTLSSSVVEQMKWAIYKMKQEHLWEIPVAKMELTYLPTGQKIIFRGADDEDKLKSTVLAKGYFKYIWYEELVQFEGMEKIRAINQSFIRGGEKYVAFYTFNPPKSIRSWVNAESTKQIEGRLVHHSNYLSVPKDWLGQPSIIEAEALKETNPEAYAHEYLGEVTGSGGEVFNNLTIRPIKEDEIQSFDYIYRGMDFGFTVDPLHYAGCSLDIKRKRLFIFQEIHEIGLSNQGIVDKVKLYNPDNETIHADSAEPRTIAELKAKGLRITGVKKYPGSVAYGIDYLQKLNEIIIDPVRCPHTKREFEEYELERDRQGELKPEFPDKNNHSIDGVRYALEPVLANKQKWGWGK